MKLLSLHAKWDGMEYGVTAELPGGGGDAAHTRGGQPRTDFRVSLHYHVGRFHYYFYMGLPYPLLY
jgi:hypothetical protein